MVEQDKPSLAILHLSDLHLGPYLQGTTRIGEWAKFSPPHRFNLLLGLEAQVIQILKEHEDRLVVVVTGDMTAAAEPPAYMAVYNYLQGYPYVSSILQSGLRLSRLNKRLYVVPGNHDVWLYGTIFTRWRGYADRLREYRKYFPQNLPSVHPIMVNKRAVTIYAIDSNRVRDRINPWNFKNVLGKGEVGDDQIGQLQAMHTNLANGTYVDVPPDFDYGSSLKIAIMHHHLELPLDQEDTFSQELLRLKDAPTVLCELSSMGVHMVLCGHQHHPYQRPDLKPTSASAHPILLSCAGSASQIDLESNSFCLYRVFAQEGGSHRVDVLTYVARSVENDWNFRCDEPSTYYCS